MRRGSACVVPVRFRPEQICAVTDTVSKQVVVGNKWAEMCGWGTQMHAFRTSVNGHRHNATLQLQM